MTDDMHGGTQDTANVIDAQTATMNIDAGPLYAEFADGESGGIRLIHDGAFICLTQGVDYEDGDRATVGHYLTPEQCRDLAASLEAVADSTERYEDDSETTPDGRESFVQRVVKSLFNKQ